MLLYTHSKKTRFFLNPPKRFGRCRRREEQTLGFRREKTKPGSFVRTLLGSVEFFYCFFRYVNSFAGVLTSAEPLWWVQEKSYFFRVYTDIDIKFYYLTIRPFLNRLIFIPWIV